jgi:hypothetical protein
MAGGLYATFRLHAMKTRWAKLARFYIALVGALPAIGSAATENFVEPPSVEDILTVAGVRVDGSLNFTRTVGEWHLGTPQGIPFKIVHRLRTTRTGQAISELSVDGLTAFAVPDGRSALHCMFLGGVEATFGLPPSTDKFVRVGNALATKGDPKGHLEIATAGGWTSVFEQGVLVSAAGPSLLELEIESQGAKILRVRANRFGGLVGELTARHDDLGRLKALRFGSQVHTFDYSDAQGQMSEWRSVVDGQEKIVRFEYAAGLLIRVMEDGKIRSEIEWGNVPGGLTSDSEWPSPVRVSKLGSLRFSYLLNYKGYHITATDEQTHRTQRRIVNPKRGIIDAIDSGRQAMRVFYGVKRGQADWGKVVRIEEHALVREYEYNNLGQMSVFRQRSGSGDQEMKFTYDQSGRHTLPATSAQR